MRFLALVFEGAEPTPKQLAALLDARAPFAWGWFRPERTRVGRAGSVDVPAGYVVLEAVDLAAAVRAAAAFPCLPGDVVEVRPVIGELRLATDVQAQAGKIFACLVAGAAPTEAAWVAAMDRIDEESRPVTSDPAFLGGARLGVVNGPFAEAREVIGGLFFLRVASLAEAIEWAEASAYARHGALELRELWRS